MSVGDRREIPELREVSDPLTLRALTHPVRIALIEALSLQGPMKATEAGEMVGERSHPRTNTPNTNPPAKPSTRALDQAQVLTGSTSDSQHTTLVKCCRLPRLLVPQKRSLYRRNANYAKSLISLIR